MHDLELQLIGAGQLGRSLGRLFAAQGVPIGAVVCRSRDSARQAIGFIGAGRAEQRPPLPEPGQVWLLALPDDALAGAAQALADGADFHGVLVLHCSGALSSEVLAPLRAAGASVASLHPLRSFADPARAVEGFAGTWCGVEGDAPALQRLVPLFESIGARCVGIRREAKTAYHAAAVVASNYLVALMEVALRLLDEAGMERETGLALLAPLACGTLDNVLARGPRDALSGPVLRGDVETVRRQVEALRPLRLAAVYGGLGEVALALARERGQADPQRLAEIAALLAAAQHADTV